MCWLNNASCVFLTVPRIKGRVGVFGQLSGTKALTSSKKWRGELNITLWKPTWVLLLWRDQWISLKMREFRVSSKYTESPTKMRRYADRPDQLSHLLYVIYICKYFSSLISNVALIRQKGLVFVAIKAKYDVVVMCVRDVFFTFFTFRETLPCAPQLLICAETNGGKLNKNVL